MLISDVPALFKQGKALTKSTTWANSATLTGVLAGFLVSAFHIAKALGYDFGVNDATLNQAAGGIAAVVLIVTNVLHTLSNPTAGLPPAAAPGPVGHDDPGPAAGPG